VSESEVKWIPVGSAAVMLKVSRARVYQLCRSGKLGCVVMGGTTLVSLRSLVDRLNSRSARRLGHGTRR
jgi:hypothetical protein